MTTPPTAFRQQNGHRNGEPQAPGTPLSDFVIDDWTVQPTLLRLERDGTETRLEPRVMDLLVYLAQHPGQLVSREELERAVWAGAIVSYDALTGAIQKLRKAFNDDPRRPRIIETLSKKGYRLVAQVRPLEDDGPVTTGRAGKLIPRRQPQHQRWQVVSVAMVLLLLATAGLLLLDDTATVPPLATASNSIVVLPFDNLSQDTEQEYFADGMTDELITGLARHPELLVIARDSSFMYRDSTVAPGEIASRLSVRCLLQGSVQRAGERLRINAQLLDSDSGSLVWAESYDGSLVDVFKLQDRITGQIVGALSAHIGASPDAEERATTGSMEAYDNFLLGRKHFYLYHNREENRKAREFFLTAVRFDDKFAMAWAMLAWTHVFDAMNGWSDDHRHSLQQALELATHALELEQALPVAYWVRGLSWREMGEYVKALVEAEKAIELDPNYANAHVLLATLLYYAGRPEEGLEKMLRAMQINPHHPFNYTFHLGQAYFILHRYDEAIVAFRKSLDSNPASERIHVWLAAALARHGELDEAQWEADQVHTLNPDFSLQRMDEALPFNNPGDKEHFLDSLRMAGLS
jgi:adenylate cyclase